MLQGYIGWERTGCQHSGTEILRVGEGGGKHSDAGIHRMGKKGASKAILRHIY